jgi:hypothetical protein
MMRMVFITHIIRTGIVPYIVALMDMSGRIDTKSNAGLVPMEAIHD